MNTHETYVSLEVAKLLKQAGFDWDCHGIYVLDSENDSEPVFSSATFKKCGIDIEDYIKFPAPTLAVAQRWLREVKEIDVIVTYEAVLNEKTDVYEKKYAVVVYDAFIRKDNNYHDTYEEAQEAGIKKVLEIILEKGE